MKSRGLTSVVLAVLVAVPFAGLEAMVTARAASADPVVTTFDYTGTVQTYVVPAGVTHVVVEAWGAQGGKHLAQTYNGNPGGGLGGHVKATIPVTPGETLAVRVGGAATSNPAGGFNGGGDGWAAPPPFLGEPGGGGASDLRQGGDALADRVIVAGGGGGAGIHCTDSCAHTAGGVGGGATGGSGADGGGAGGTATSGYALGMGGDGVGGEDCGTAGGGGGFWGGFGGGFFTCGQEHLQVETPGGGGSGYVTPSAVAALNESGLRAGNGLVTITEPVLPGAPTIGTAAAGNASVAVNFAPGSDGGTPITGYTAACTSSNGGVSGSGSGAASPVVVSGLTNGKTYTCTVTATNAVGTSAPSVPSNAVLVGAPGAPIGVSVSPGLGSVSVSWTAPPANAAPIDDYDVSCVSSNGGSPGSASVSASPVTITGLTNAKTYTCTVTATNSVGTGAGSVSSSFIVGTVPAAPTIGTATRGNKSASVTFFAGSNGGIPITSFTVTCTSTNGGAWSYATGSSSPIVVSNLTNGYTYTCRVTATNAQGTSPPSAPSNTFQPATVPTAPTIGTVSVSGATATVPFGVPSKNGGTAITSYTATCTSSNGGTTRTGSGAASPVSVSSLTGGKTYTCSVRATNAVGTGPASAASNAVTVVIAPDAPTGVKAVSGSTTAATGSLTVTFTAPANNGGSAITSYTATCTSTNGGVTKTGVRTGATAAPITVAGVTTGKTYTCRVTATNAIGTGVASAPSLAVIVGSPAPPTNVKAVSGSATTTTGSLTVTFAIGANNGSAITSQTATCVSSSGGVTKTGTRSGATAGPITVAGVTTGVPYTCTVKATNARGAGLASAPSLPVIVGSPVPPTAVKAVSAATTTATGSLTVTFTIGANNGSAITSQTATCVSSNGGVTKTGSRSGATAGPITVIGVTTGKTYTCTVKATNARGPSPASAPSLPVIVGSPAPPTGVTAVKVASGQIRVSFTPGANNGSATTSYTATCTSSNGGVAGSKTGAASPLTVTGLTAAKTYKCTVKGTNARGAGLSSAPSGAVVA